MNRRRNSRLVVVVVVAVVVIVVILSICRLHLAAASEKRERAHLDICSLNRLQPNAVFNDLLSMRISNGVDACEFVWVCVSGSLTLDAVRRKRFYRYFMCKKLKFNNSPSLKRKANENVCYCTLFTVAHHWTADCIICTSTSINIYR